MELHLLFYYTSFFELCSERGENGYIGILAIQQYAINLGLQNEDYDSFLFYIKGMDSIYRKIRGSTSGQPQQPSPQNAKPKA